MNSDVIRLLPDSVANQIAAGEVIQRPASVIKELVENSIDAGATSVQIIVKDAGRTLIQVVDNGCGMTPTDARMAFERHATSKIKSADDLYTLHTMGFRGEALPSIAAVAQIELKTMRAGEPIGCKLKISESKFEGMEACACLQGTNLMVKNLFFHMPARRKFLKKDSVELSHILKEFERLALVNTNVDFTFIHNDETLYQLLKGSLKQRIKGLYGKNSGHSITDELIPIGTETSMVKISGFVSLPHYARRRKFQQFLFVNGRNMRHPYFHKAIVSCYNDLIPNESQPSYFINLEVDPSTIDVNIHPQKHEIKFENEQPIWQILTAAIKQSLGKINAAGAIDFDSPDALPDIPVFYPDSKEDMPGIETDTNYDPFDLRLDDQQPQDFSGAIEIQVPAQPQSSPSRLERKSGINRATNWDKLYDSFSSRRETRSNISTSHDNERFAEIPSHISIPKQVEPEVPQIFDEPEVPSSFLNIDNRYIVVSSRNGLLLVHRFRAHVRVLFDDFIQRLSNTSLPSQHLMFPETVTLSPSQSSVLSSIVPLVAKMGYDVSFLGDNVWAINAMPSLPGNANLADTLIQVINDISETGEVTESALLKPASIALARSAAASMSQNSESETESLISSLWKCAEPDYTPDGLKIMYTVSYHEISKMFN